MSVIDGYLDLLAFSRAGSKFLSVMDHGEVRMDRVIPPSYLPAPVFDFEDLAVTMELETARELLKQSLTRLALGKFVLPYPLCYYADHIDEVDQVALTRVQWINGNLCVDTCMKRHGRWFHVGCCAELTPGVCEDTQVRFMHRKSPEATEYYIGHMRQVMDEMLIYTAALSVPQVHTDAVGGPVSKLRQRKAGLNEKRPLPLFKRVTLPADFRYTPPRAAPRLLAETERTVQAHTRRAHLRHLPPASETPVPVAEVNGGDPYQRHYKVKTRPAQAPDQALADLQALAAADLEATIQALEALAASSDQVAAELRSAIARLRQS